MPKYRVEVGGSYYGGDNDERIEWEDEAIITAPDEREAIEIAVFRRDWPTTPDWTESEEIEEEG